jgi:hypothetical protein
MFSFEFLIAMMYRSLKFLIINLFIFEMKSKILGRIDKHQFHILNNGIKNEFIEQILIGMHNN